MTTSRSKNGSVQHEHSGAHAVEFFAKAGSLFTNRGEHYGGETSALELFKNVWYSGDYEMAVKLLFWLRDPRGGAGNRSGFRECASWLSQEAPEWVISNASQIPKYGRWDDMSALYSNAETAETASNIWANEILSNSVLAAKWATRKDRRLLRAVRKLGDIKDIGDYRRLLSKVRSGVIEVAMSKKSYDTIDYSKVPSVAMSRYTNAFNRNDSDRFIEYKGRLEKAIETGDKSVKVNTGAIFPHDVMRTMRNGDRDMADMQFASLPNFMKDSNARIMPIADTSGSMDVQISGDVRAVDISQGLALYCSDKLGKDNPFYRKFMQFCDEAKLTDWGEYKTVSKAMDARLFNGAIGSTDIIKSLDTILKYGKMFNATKEQMPNHLLIISDMQFNSDSSYGWGNGTTPNSQDATVVNVALEKWKSAGFDKPNIIYWNTAGNSGSPEKATTPNTCLVSGFSPSILKAIFTNPDSMSPYNVMMEAIKDYEVIVPQ